MYVAVFLVPILDYFLLLDDKREIVLASDNPMYQLACLQNSEKYCIRMPNKWNFSFDYFYAAILALGIYVPGEC